MRKMILILTIVALCAVAGFIARAQYFDFNPNAKLQGRYKHPDGKGYIEFTCQTGKFICYTKEEYDGRIYYGTYTYIPNLNFNNLNDQSSGKVTLNWVAGNSCTLSVSGVGGRSLSVSGAQLAQSYNLTLTREGEPQITNEEILALENNRIPKYYAQTKPNGSGTGFGASYAGKWTRTDGKVVLELSTDGVAKHESEGKVLFGKYDYLPPLMETNGSLFLYWQGRGELKCYITKLTNSEMVIQSPGGVETFRYESPKTITKAEADQHSINGTTPSAQSGGTPQGASPPRSAGNTSLVGKWEYDDKSGFIEFSKDTYFKITAVKSQDKSYGTFTREWDTGRVRLHFAGQNAPTSIAIRSINPKELILESSTRLPGKLHFIGATALSRAEVVRVLRTTLDAQGGEGEATNLFHSVCFTCHGTGAESCSRCNGTGSITEYEDRYNASTGRYDRYPVTVSCPQCSGKGCQECHGTTCSTRRAIDQFSNQRLHQFGLSCRSFGPSLKYHLVANGFGGQKVIYKNSY